MDGTKDSSDKPVGDSTKINEDPTPSIEVRDKEDASDKVDGDVKTTEEKARVTTIDDEPDKVRNDGDTAQVSTEVSDKDASDENVKNDGDIVKVLPEVGDKCASVGSVEVINDDSIICILRAKQEDTGVEPVDENVKTDDVTKNSLEVDNQESANDKSGDENVKHEDDVAKISTEVDDQKDTSDKSADDVKINEDVLKVSVEVDGKDAVDTSLDDNTSNKEAKASSEDNQEASENVEVSVDTIKSSEEEVTVKKDSDIPVEENDKKIEDATENLTETDGNKDADVLVGNDEKASEETSTVELIEDKKEEISVVEASEEIPTDSETTIIDDGATTRVLEPITHDGRGMDPDIKKSLEKYLDDNGIRNHTMTMAPGSNVGDNMVSMIAKVKITGTDKNGSSVGLNWIVKIAPQLEIFRKMIRVELIFEREIYMYKTVFPAFRTLEDEKSIANFFDSYPKFVFANMEPYKESFVMNDVKSVGYVLKNKREPLDVDHVKLVMKTYGRFHALSYALKHHKPALFETLANNTKDLFRTNITDLDEFKQGHQSVIDDARATLDPVKDALLLTKFAQYRKHFLDLFVSDKEFTNKYSVIAHGDSWINNMLFKYDDASHPTLPTDVCFLDFQFAKFGSPACDLSYFIFTCTDKAFRDAHYNAMIKLYYYTLCAHLNDLGCDPEKYLPFHALETELKKFAVVGLHMSLLALSGMAKEAEEICDEESAKIKNRDLYNERVRNIIIDFAHRGYFDYVNYFQ